MTGTRSSFETLQADFRAYFEARDRGAETPVLAARLLHHFESMPGRPDHEKKWLAKQLMLALGDIEIVTRVMQSFVHELRQKAGEMPRRAS